MRFTKKSKKQLINDMYTYRLANFGNHSYQMLSGDRQLEFIPDTIWDLWYSPDKVSFKTLALNYRSDIDQMTSTQLNKRIADEKYLLSLLRKEFARLEN